jgi:hypothetical protein
MNDKPKLSCFLPSIRSHFLVRWYDSFLKSIGPITHEIVIASPFDLPEELAELDNWKLIKTFRHPTAASQLAALNCSANHLYTTTDDVLFEPNVLEDLYNFSLLMESIHNEDLIIGAPYREGSGFSGKTLPSYYWETGPSYGNFPYINPNYGINCHFLIKRDTFRKYGGFDCRYGYLNHATHTFQILLQDAGGRFINFGQDVCSADHYPDTTNDHSFIHHQQTGPDTKTFIEDWSKPGGPPLPELDNWKHTEEFCGRFKGKMWNSYQELYPEIVH